jgi:hypothetical protein
VFRPKKEKQGFFASIFGCCSSKPKAKDPPLIEKRKPVPEKPIRQSRDSDQAERLDISIEVSL